MRQLILLNSKDLIHQVPEPVPTLPKCSQCKTPAILYQQKTCKACLTKKFKHLRPLIDMTRQITITRLRVAQ